MSPLAVMCPLSLPLTCKVPAIPASPTCEPSHSAVTLVKPLPSPTIFPNEPVEVNEPLMFPLAVMCELALIFPETFIPVVVVSNFVELLCFNTVPAPSVNIAIELPSETSLI